VSCRIIYVYESRDEIFNTDTGYQISGDVRVGGHDGVVVVVGVVGLCASPYSSRLKSNRVMNKITFGLTSNPAPSPNCPDIKKKENIYISGWLHFVFGSLSCLDLANNKIISWLWSWNSCIENYIVETPLCCCSRLRKLVTVLKKN